MRRRCDTMPGLLLNLLLVVPLFNLASAGGGHGGHKHVVIHVPYKVKTIHHTHTITKHIHHGGGDKYEVLGYTVGHPIDLHGGGHGGGGGGGFGGHDFGGGGGGGGHDFGGGDGGGGGHDFGGGHLDFGGGGGGGGGGYDFGGGGGFGGGGHEEWSSH
ncbi:PREDICTED: glycine-rich cell wall structural protein 1.0-like [Dinoponera quadriceps]|uniref:Glycine-rich cell wall structural protein 1.0-like n=1 Tax=Dinoponera quadriceps TaxID=609295 RepID=A0A6P3WVR0_DINQU|nr:PREDICTED: glycine-rich cell wall structural protein 1.0-like [Dinoponera quadriceps]